MTFGSRVRQLRKSHRLTLRELAAQVGIDFTYLSKIENDQGAPPAEGTIGRLADVLGVDKDELTLLANKLPEEFALDLLNRPERQVAELYRSMAGKSYTNEEWREIVQLLRDKGDK